MVENANFLPFSSYFLFLMSVIVYLFAPTVNFISLSTLEMEIFSQFTSDCVRKSAIPAITAFFSSSIFFVLVVFFVIVCSVTFASFIAFLCSSGDKSKSTFSFRSIALSASKTFTASSIEHSSLSTRLSTFAHSLSDNFLTLFTPYWLRMGQMPHPLRLLVAHLPLLCSLNDAPIIHKRLHQGRHLLRGHFLTSSFQKLFNHRKFLHQVSRAVGTLGFHLFPNMLGEHKVLFLFL